MTLEPIDPESAVEWYLDDKKQDNSKATVTSHRSRLGHLLGWLEDEGIDNMNDLTGRQIQRYRTWRRNDGDLAPATEKTEMDSVRVFVRWCESIDAVESDLFMKVQSPRLSADDNTRDQMLEPEKAKSALSYLHRYKYASIEHVTMVLLWRTMMRRGAARALDVEDYNPDEQFIEIKHRPDTDTPLKNKYDGERCVALSSDLCGIFDDWLEQKRPEMTDDHGRNPFLATNYGRAHVTTIANYSYSWTRPCVYDEPCPHDRDPKECEAIDTDNESKCPTSVAPHAIRRGSITHHLSNDVPEGVVSDRANVSSDVLDQHYDRRSERDKMEQRREYLSNI
jgi:integrase